MKTKTAFVAVLLAAILASTSLAQTKGLADDLRTEIRRTVKGLGYTSDGTDNLKTLFIPKNDKLTLRESVLLWVKCKPVDHQPAGIDEAEEDEIEEFFSDLVAPQDWWGDEEKAEAKRWQQLKELIQQKVYNPQVFYIGNADNYRIIVVAGKDSEGNVVGVWMRDWSEME